MESGGADHRKTGGLNWKRGAAEILGVVAGSRGLVPSGKPREWPTMPVGCFFCLSSNVAGVSEIGSLISLRQRIAWTV